MVAGDAGPPRTPRGFGRESRLLWKSVVDEYELDRHELLILVQACRCVDRLQRIAVELEAAPSLTVESPRGLVTSPLVVEERLQAQSLSRLLATLRLPSGEQDGQLVRPQRRGASRSSYGTRVVGP